MSSEFHPAKPKRQETLLDVLVRTLNGWLFLVVLRPHVVFPAPFAGERSVGPTPP